MTGRKIMDGIQTDHKKVYIFDLLSWKYTQLADNINIIDRADGTLDDSIRRLKSNQERAGRGTDWRKSQQCYKTV